MATDDSENKNEDIAEEQTTPQEESGTQLDKIAADQQAESAEKPEAKHVSRRKLAVFILLALVVLTAAGASAWFAFWRDHGGAPNITSAVQNDKKDNKQTPVQPAASEPQVASNLLESAQKLPDQHFFTNYNSYFPQTCANSDCTKERNLTDNDLTYYQVGKLQNGDQLIAATYPSDWADGSMLAEEAYGHTVILGKYSTIDSAAAKEIEKTLAKNVTIDLSNSSINELNFPAKLAINGISLTSSYQTNDDATRGYFLPHGLSNISGGAYAKIVASTQLTKIGSTDGKDIYEATTIDSGNYQAKEWYATKNQIWAAAYNVNDPLNSPLDYSSSSQPTVKINWTSGQKNLSAYGNPFISCGTSGYMVAKNTEKSQLKPVGTGPNGQEVYALPDNSPLLNELYSVDYKNLMGDITNKALRNLTLSQFQDTHAVIVSMNSLGEMVIHVRSEMFLGGGCGKPVVYLYPTKTTSVGVKVGAEVVKSNPFYPNASGWQNVLARSSGQLTYQGKNYDSLFWEGHGYGRYPLITSGTVVASSRAPATIREQLAKQGLNQHEINDFMAFWQPRLPHTPYVRLTWLDTKLMNQVAPLTITPKPTTVIRVFLDFEGLNQPIKLAPQALSAPSRQGFTVVEWGGLLRSGL